MRGRLVEKSPRGHALHIKAHFCMNKVHMQPTSERNSSSLQSISAVFSPHFRGVVPQPICCVYLLGVHTLILILKKKSLHCLQRYEKEKVK